MRVIPRVAHPRSRKAPHSFVRSERAGRDRAIVLRDNMKKLPAGRILQETSQMTRATTYVVCSLIEAAGMALVLWDGVPLFRHLIRLEQTGTGVDEKIMAVAVVLILTPYWALLRHDPPFDLPRQQFLGHIFLLINRLVFIFASGVFSLVVYRYWDVFDPSFLKATLMMAVLFAVFCFSRHLERLGNLLNAGYKSRPPR